MPLLFEMLQLEPRKIGSSVEIIKQFITFVGVVGAEVAELFDAHVLDLGHKVHG